MGGACTAQLWDKVMPCDMVPSPSHVVWSPVPHMWCGPQSLTCLTSTVSSLHYNKSSFNTSIPILSPITVGTPGPTIVTTLLLYVNYDQFAAGSVYLPGYSSPYLYVSNATSWELEGTSTLFNYSSFKYNPLTLYQNLNTGLTIANYSYGTYPLTVQSAEYRCYDVAGIAYLVFPASVYLYNTVMPPGNYTVDLNPNFYGNRYASSSSVQIVIAIKQGADKRGREGEGEGRVEHDVLYLLT